MASTRSRPRDREIARPTTGGVAAEHATKINVVVIVSVLVIVAFLAFTSIGHVVDAATQHFMLFYAGVFALIGLCTAVGLGLVSTDRMFLHPGQRVMLQAAHRAASFGALAFLIIHVVTEILAQRVHVVDSVIPFLSPFRTFYIGLGTIAGDIIILLAVTGIMRGRFNASGKAWRWRAIHYTAYAALVFGVWHGLLGGRPGKPYVDWSYGFVIAFALLGVAVRVLSNSLRPKENLSSPPIDQQASSASAPLRAAAMLAQYGGSRVGKTSIMGGAATGAHTMLSAPVTATVVPAAALPAADADAASGRPQPFYEPGYDGPPRYLGAPRNSGPTPRPTGAMPRANTGSMPRADTGSMPRANTGAMPRANTGAMPRVPTGPMPVDPMPRHPSGPMPVDPMPRHPSGPVPAMGHPSGPMPTMTGPFPAAPGGRPGWTGPMPRVTTGAMPRVDDDDWDPRSAPRSAPRGPVAPPPGGSGPMPAWGERGPRSGPSPLPHSYGRPDYDERPRYQGPPEYREPQQYQERSGYQDGPGTGPRPAWPDQGWPDQGWPEGGQGQAWPDQGWPEEGPDQWLEESHDGGRYQERPPWDGYLPESEDIRYREPGPGMPGYRGAREYRHGGDHY